MKFVELACYLEDRLGLQFDLAMFGAFHQSGEKPCRQDLITNIQEGLIDLEAAATQAG